MNIPGRRVLACWMTMEPSTSPPPVPSLVAPTVAEWRALSASAREAFLERVNTALSDPVLMMTEGRLHKKAKSQLIDALGLYFRTLGQAMYLAEEMSVIYPGEVAFSPDVLAVAGVAEPEYDDRMGWVVADEGRGIDLAFEVLHAGDRKKDLVDNVERCARLGISEYFVYDRRDDRLLGYRLTPPEARRYQRIVPQLGKLHSAVLGLDFAIEAGRLRIFHGTSELYGSTELIDRLARMLASVEAKADQAEARAEEAEARGEAALEGLRTTLWSLCAARGLAPTEEARARVAATVDPAVLHGWLLRAIGAGAIDEVFGE